MKSNGLYDDTKREKRWQDEVWSCAGCMGVNEDGFKWSGYILGQPCTMYEKGHGLV